MNGAYVKSICEIKTACVANTAATECQKYGMQLFAMTTNEEFQKSTNFFQKLYGVALGPSIIVNGIKENGTWSVFNPNKRALFAGAIPKDLNNLPCLRIYANGSAIITNSITCNTTYSWVFCEWI